MVALTSKGQNFDDFRGKTPAAMATERMRSHRAVHFPSAHFGLTGTDCPCPLGPGHSLLLIFINNSTMKFANFPGRASATSQMSQINFFHQSNSIQLLVSSVIDSRHTRLAARRSGGYGQQMFILAHNFL
jgi:hypothetical protein